MTTKAKRTTQTKYLVLLAMLIAIQIIFAATPIGYLFIPFFLVHITIMHLPVIIGAITMGPLAGGVLGFVFGLTSMIVATIRNTPDSIVFSPFRSESLWSIFIAIVPRVLFGVLTALLYKALLKARLPQRVSAGIAGGVGALLHTTLVLASIYLLLGNMYAELMEVAFDTLLTALVTVGVTNGALEALVAILVIVPLVKPLTITQAHAS